jgi:type II restriction/modification system DNA methylase subunit YeeA
MNKAKLKSYAPQARKDFIAAVTARAHRLGLADNNGQLQIAPAEKNGDLVIIAGQSWPAKISRQRDNLIALIQKHGFAQTMENVAYTWFNRFAALRYMEIHDYLNHGYRVLSNRAGGLPEILGSAPELAQHGDLPGLKPERAIELKLAGDQDGELYRLTLIAQCNALSNAMPFLFERIDDETELLLPDNLLLTDSVVAKLVDAIPEEDWSQVEIIGWLYQFYISEKKDQVIGKVVKSEDIPAATQLFTPNWIVQYLVQNSIGRLWLMANPDSPLKSQWPYYIEPAEQTPEVQAQLDALIQARMAEDGGSLNPETLTVLDPACGSGHILVEAYEVLKAIYLERGYQPRSIPRLILEKNLFGLDIDDRAAQLAGFALLMKARADDRRLLDNPPELNVLALQESKGLDVDQLAQALSGYAALTPPLISSLLDTFSHIKTFGSLIQIPADLNAQLPAIEEDLQQAVQSGDLLAQAVALDLLPFTRQARILGMQFDAVVANPPYMGNKYLTPLLKFYLKDNYKDFEKDLFSTFIIRNLSLTKQTGQLGFMSPFVWMFISSYQGLRQHIIGNATLTTLVQLEYSGFDGATVPICTFTLGKAHVVDFTGSYIRLSDFRGSDQQAPKTLKAIQNPNCGWLYTAKPDNFKAIPGSPVAYWVSSNILKVLKTSKKLGEIADARMGLATGNNAKYVRLWFEVSLKNIGFFISDREAAKKSKLRWFPYCKGGEFRKWYGNNEYIIDWFDDGAELQTTLHPSGTRVWAHNFNLDHIFQDSLTWSDITSGLLSVRYNSRGFLFDGSGTCAFFRNENEKLASLGLLNTQFANNFSKILNPTMHFQTGDFRNMPYRDGLLKEDFIDGVKQLVAIAKSDWDFFETSWDFLSNPLISTKQKTLETSYLQWQMQNSNAFAEMRRLEEENNRFFIEAYGLQDELSPEVPEDQITLTRAGREKDCQRLISYAIGCMTGRYSLDESGLIYALAGNVGFDPSRYHTFPADADGIVPITDELWFEDDAANRIREFLLAVWGAETLEENLAWLAESLGQKANETPQETIRRYLAGSFFKEHLQTYKKRPIYWLFSSGKQGAFQALVYLHRYHEGTLARMRAEYVVSLTGKMQSRIEMLEKDAAATPSNAVRNKLSKDIEKLKKKHVELLAYDEKLHHYADLRIKLDLDDGVKVNYSKFGDLLADVKAVTGGTSDD